MEQFNTLCPETSMFVEALCSVLASENKWLDAFCRTYGEEGGSKQFEESGIKGAFDALKEKMHQSLGLSVELGLAGLLSRPSCVLDYLKTIDSSK